MLAPWKESYDKPKQCIKKQRYHFVNKGPYSQSYSFSNIHVRMWELDYKESQVPKNWCFQSVVLNKTLEIPLDSKEIKPINPKEISPEYSWEGLMLKLNTLTTWCKEPTHWKIPWCWERLKAGGEADDRGWDGWHHQLNGHKFEQTLGNGEWQGSLLCCSPWGHNYLDTTEWLNNKFSLKLHYKNEITSWHLPNSWLY